MSGSMPFPANFTWGSATASYQVEGAVNEDGRAPSIWDTFSHTPEKILNGDNGDIACDHYHRWRDDIGIMRALNLNAYRFSVAWPRVIPTGTGAVNEAGLDFYDRLVDGLLEAGITPWATLYHWDLPQVLQDAGGWPNRATAEAFVHYVDAVTCRLGDRVKNWITINEPWVIAFLGYLTGEHAPGRVDLTEALAAAHHVLLAHGLAMPVIRANVPDARAGITLNLTNAIPATDNPMDVDAARRADGYTNRFFLDPLAGRGYPADMVRLWTGSLPAVTQEDLDLIAIPTDFLGINYYSPWVATNDPTASPVQAGRASPHGEYTAMGWYVHPDSLRDLLVRVATDYPATTLVITENGAAYEDPSPVSGTVHDHRRRAYCQGHLRAVREAISAGAPVTGYFAWSLLDNFEWAFGYERRFGIVYVDFETQQRTIKESGLWYGNVARTNALS